MLMIFAFDNDDKGLSVFSSEEDAIAAHEGIDVEESPVHFWDLEGNALTAVFTKPNVRGTFTVVSGTYHLEPCPTGVSLVNMLAQVSYVQGNAPLNSIEAVRQHLTRQGLGLPDGSPSSRRYVATVTSREVR